MPFFRPGGDAPFREEGDTWQGLNGVGQVPTTSPPLLKDTKPHRADPCNAKQSSNMQQLTLQFDGYADSRPAIDVGATKQRSKESECSHSGNVVFPHWERSIPTLGTWAALRAWLGQSSPLVSSLAGESVSRLNAIFAAVAVVSGFLFASFMAILQG